MHGLVVYSSSCPPKSFCISLVCLAPTSLLCYIMSMQKVIQKAYQLCWPTEGNGWCLLAGLLVSAWFPVPPSVIVASCILGGVGIVEAGVCSYWGGHR